MQNQTHVNQTPCVMEKAQSVPSYKIYPMEAVVNTQTPPALQELVLIETDNVPPLVVDME